MVGVIEMGKVGRRNFLRWSQRGWLRLQCRGRRMRSSQQILDLIAELRHGWMGLELSQDNDFQTDEQSLCSAVR